MLPSKEIIFQLEFSDFDDLRGIINGGFCCLKPLWKIKCLLPQYAYHSYCLIETRSDWHIHCSVETDFTINLEMEMGKMV